MPLTLDVLYKNLKDLDFQKCTQASKQLPKLTLFNFLLMVVLSGLNATLSSCRRRFLCYCQDFTFSTYYYVCTVHHWDMILYCFWWETSKQKFYMCNMNNIYPPTWVIYLLEPLDQLMILYVACRNSVCKIRCTVMSMIKSPQQLVIFSCWETLLLDSGGARNGLEGRAELLILIFILVVL